ncbi:MAG: hypothetical protein IJ059_05110 [Prevotella sp.]|nr:hypothetical protein [Prevotella sp.]
MKIELHRKWRKKEYSIGILYVNGQRICETLEDEDRGLQAGDSIESIKVRKVKGETAIPIGTYQVTWTYSPRFKKMLPLLNGVPGYEGIRIHSGNKAKDTEGCILCGRNTEVGAVTNSRYWTNKVNAMIEKAAKEKEQIVINIHW